MDTNNLFESLLGACADGEHMLEFHKEDEFTGTLYDYCLKCEHMIPRQEAE